MGSLVETSLVETRQTSLLTLYIAYPSFKYTQPALIIKTSRQHIVCHSKATLKSTGSELYSGVYSWEKYGCNSSFQEPTNIYDSTEKWVSSGHEGISPLTDAQQHFQVNCSRDPDLLAVNKDSCRIDHYQLFLFKLATPMCYCFKKSSNETVWV